MATNPANDLLIRTVMTSFTGLVEDQVVNDFALRSVGISDAAAIAAADAMMQEFWREDDSAGNSVGEYISNFVDRGATHEIQVYRIQADGSLDSPIGTSAWLGPKAALSTSGQATEVQGVLSFHADLSGVLEESGATRPRARRRGRLYIGPLNNQAIDETTPPYFLSDEFRFCLQSAGSRLISLYGGGWSVWSRADGTLRSVVGGWTDNAPDTQRRRGVTSTSRTTFS